MYARTVRMQLKPNSVAEFTRTLEHTIIPLLRTQPGFQDVMACVVPGWHGRGARQGVGRQQACRSLSARHLSRRAEGLGACDGGHAAGAPLDGVELDLPLARRSRRPRTRRGRVCAVGAATSAIW